MGTVCTLAVSAWWTMQAHLQWALHEQCRHPCSGRSMSNVSILAVSAPWHTFSAQCDEYRHPLQFTLCDECRHPCSGHCVGDASNLSACLRASVTLCLNPLTCKPHCSSSRTIDTLSERGRSLAFSSGH